MTEVVGLDYSYARPDPAALVAAGYSFVIRYVSPLGSGRAAPGQPNPKDVTADELRALTGAGLAVGLVFETYAERPMGGSSAGHDDGQTAAARAAAVGYPHECVMWWAVDFPAPAAALPTLQAYGEGFAAGWGGPEHGPYASASIVDGLAQHFPRRWQTAAWSGPVLSPNADVLQRSTHHHPLPAGISASDVDENVLCRPTVPFYRGQVVPPRPSPAPPTPAQPAGPAPFDAAAWVTGWRAARGDTGAVFALLQGWGNEAFRGYCRISPTAPVYGPATAAFLCELAHRAALDPALPASISRPALKAADGQNIGPNLAPALVHYGLPGYLQRAGFRG